jgi:hypothetical protein
VKTRIEAENEHRHVSRRKKNTDKHRCKKANKYKTQLHNYLQSGSHHEYMAALAHAAHRPCFAAGGVQVRLASLAALSQPIH